MIRLQGTMMLTLTLSVTASGASLMAQQPPGKHEAKSSALSQKQIKPRARTDRYGDPLPEGAIARLGTVRLRHDSMDGDTVISPGDKTVATQGNGDVRLWSMSTGKLLWRTRVNHMPGSLVRSPDGKLLAITETNIDDLNRLSPENQSVCLLDTATGRLRQRLRTDGYVLAFSPNSKLAAIRSDDKSICLWEIKTGRRLFQMKGHKARATTAAFVADGRTLITADYIRTICHWDLAEGKLRKSLDTEAPPSWTLRLSPDGRTLAVTPQSGAAVRLYDTETGKLRCVLQGDPAAARYGLAFSSDSRILATDWAEPWAEHVKISLWDATTGKPLRRFKIGPWPSEHSLSLAPDGRTVAIASDAEIQLWDSITGKPLLTLPAHKTSIMTLAFAPDGRHLVSSDGHTLRLWERSSGVHLRELSRETWGILRDLAVTPDGRGVFSGGYMAARLHDLATGEERHRFLLDEHPEKVPKPVTNLNGHSVYRVGLSADGRSAACISFAPGKSRPVFEAHIWDLVSGRLLAHRDLGPTVFLRGITPDAAATIEDRFPLRWVSIRDEANSHQLVLRDIRTGRLLVTLNLPDLFRTFACPVSPDGRTLVTATIAASQEKKEIRWGASTIRFWELASGKERQSIASPHAGWPFSFNKLAFTPDGRTVAVVRNDRTLQLWDAVMGKEVLRRGGFDSEVTALAFAPDGRSLATGHRDSTILIWDTATPKRPAERANREPDAKELEQWWTALAGDDAHAAWTAIWKMIAAPKQGLPLLRQRLKPAKAFPPDEANRLIDDLDSSDYAKREAATKGLGDLGERVVPALEKALKEAPSLEKRRRIDNLLPSSDVVRSREVLQAVRAIEVLEHIGTAEAEPILKTLASGMAESRITREAKASLERLAVRHRAKTEPRP